LSGLPLYVAVAVTAINWFACAWFKRHLSRFAALSAGSRIHLATSAAAESATPASAAAALSFASIAAGSATLGFISVTLLGEELLILSAEGEVDAAVHTLECFVGVSHGWPPLFKY
jgi:hypothetical protein